MTDKAREAIARVIIGPREDKHVTPEELEELRDIRWGWCKGDANDALQAADAILAALPEIIRQNPSIIADMVEPLEWSVDERGDWKAFCNVIGDCEAGWDDGAWAQVWGPSMWSYEPEAECRNLTADDARRAVEGFRIATILKALGMKEGE